MTDPAGIAAALHQALRAHGVRAGTRRAQTFASVLCMLPPATLEALYWRARVAMLPGIADLPAFDAAFFATFAPPRHAAAAERPRAPTVQRASLPPPPSLERADSRGAERAPPQFIAAGTEEPLAERAFDELDDGERALMLRLMGRVRVAADYRRSRRRRPGARGDRFDMRATLRGAARSHGELLRRHTTRPRLRLRPLVFLIDVSGSMGPFARALVQYARVAARARGRVRAFAFATELTELTALLRHASDERLMTALGPAIRGYGGGTRIGAAVEAFNRDHARRGAARGGTVVILSDGWERDDPARLGWAMASLRRLTRRIVWVNPHKRHPAYEPLARGMAAAMPYLDAFVSGHNLRTLEAVADAIEGRD